ncbi:pheA operon leader peptide PheL [Salmonella bongori]|uniref:PheA operon leader peptide PheL n=1 Tax=Salmonella bongori TaxID=54736 RepID=A0A7T8LMM7_SALBN|nr:pheA operon leader peptide PheL [Salmonella bongori]EHM2231511.1 pheA operon leader peptide PheL [Salmonella bongori]EHU5135706.1 pheA operon leader peptide PheL [Salmonella bongori]EIL5513363.1 pheA operon leader peptide PheL [Salmonella bongori]EIT4622621.1 pheA operon leader peptide PheL [Salmonella bongori]EIU0395081.1 pheA operon leader peptide PheL [Salmonella bongori]
MQLSRFFFAFFFTFP